MSFGHGGQFTAGRSWHPLRCIAKASWSRNCINTNVASNGAGQSEHKQTDMNRVLTAILGLLFSAMGLFAQTKSADTVKVLLIADKNSIDRGQESISGSKLCDKRHNNWDSFGR
jgi:hypothetical protein